MERKPVVFCTAGLLLLMMMGSAWAQSNQQPSNEQPSLADIAKKKPTAKAKHVVTNDEIPPSPEANNPPAGSADASAGTAASGPGAKPEGKKEAAKPGAAADKQTKLQQLMKEQADLQKVINQLQQMVDGSTDQNRIASLSGPLQHAKDQLAANQAEIDKLKAGGGAGPSGATPGQPPAPK